MLVIKKRAHVINLSRREVKRVNFRNSNAVAKLAVNIFCCKFDPLTKKYQSLLSVMAK
jgi:hypothetical protein